MFSFIYRNQSAALAILRMILLYWRKAYLLHYRIVSAPTRLGYKLTTSKPARQHRETSKRLGKQSSVTAEQTRADILDAALKLFAKNGYATTTLREISEQAGVSHGLIRHHFGPKEEVFTQLITNRLALLPQIQAQILLQIPDELPVNEQFFLLLLKTATSLTNRPELLQILLHETFSQSERVPFLLDSIKEIIRPGNQLLQQVKQQNHLKQFQQQELDLLILALIAIPRITPALGQFSRSMGVSADSELISKGIDSEMIFFAKVMAPLLGLAQDYYQSLTVADFEGVTLEENE